MLSTINFEETELRLGLPGGCVSSTNNNNNHEDQVGKNNNGKRGYSETNVDLKLNLSSICSSIKDTKVDQATVVEQKLKEQVVNPKPAYPVKPPAKAQVVGWPPVRSFRKNIASDQKKNNIKEEQNHQKAANSNLNNSATFVKVSMDGAPYLRKLDLKLYKSYPELSDALGKMFSSFTIGNCGSQGLKDFMNESKLIDLLNDSEYVATYEDKDGDWMLVGDVPWEMFVYSCNRLRIMKGSEAIGLAPRAVEKCKNRS